MSTNENAPISGKDIVISDVAQPAMLQQILQGMLAELGDGCNMHDQVRALIEVCVAEGVTKGTDIIAAIAEFGFDRKHVGLWLAQNCGPSAKRHRWFKDGDGFYRLHG